MELICLESLDQLLARAEVWNELWLRSASTSPMCRAETINCWSRQFAPSVPFRALVVQQREHMVAALPLVGRTVGRVFSAGGLPTNNWCQCGELLIDESVDIDEALGLLASGFARLPWQLLWLDGVRLSTERWRRFGCNLESRGLIVHPEPRFEIGWIELDDCWLTMQQRWSKGFRKSLRRNSRKLDEAGEVRLSMFADVDEAELELLTTRALQVESRSWKAPMGTSVLETPGMAEFYFEQWRQLAERGELLIAFLELDGVVIAFEIGWLAKNVYHSFKVGYDQEFAKFGPGQLLFNLLMESFQKNNTCRAIDCMGPMSPALRHWRPDSYSIGRLIVSDRNLTGRALVAAYKHASPPIRRLRSRVAND
jgi:hypothetical protein